LFEISVTLGQGILHAQVEEVLSTTIHELVNGVLSDEDVLRAVELSRSKYLGRLASYSDLAHTINESLALGDWTDAESFPNSLKLIKRSDVIEVAKRYLLDDTKTLGILRTL
jgi:predicted Zn-dependent peptidase